VLVDTSNFAPLEGRTVQHWSKSRYTLRNGTKAKYTGGLWQYDLYSKGEPLQQTIYDVEIGLGKTYELVEEDQTAC
jgi:hypothetical protein